MTTLRIFSFSCEAPLATREPTYTVHVVASTLESAEQKVRTKFSNHYICSLQEVYPVVEGEMWVL